jgi:hypothetical protein
MCVCLNLILYIWPWGLVCQLHATTNRSSLRTLAMLALVVVNQIAQVTDCVRKRVEDSAPHACRTQILTATTTTPTSDLAAAFGL